MGGSIGWHYDCSWWRQSLMTLAGTPTAVASGGDVASYHGPGTNNCMVPNRNLVDYAGTDSDLRELADPNAAAEPFPAGYRTFAARRQSMASCCRLLIQAASTASSNLIWLSIVAEILATQNCRW